MLPFLGVSDSRINRSRIRIAFCAGVIYIGEQIYALGNGTVEYKHVENLYEGNNTVQNKCSKITIHFTNAEIKDSWQFNTCSYFFKEVFNFIIKVIVYNVSYN